MSCGYEYCSAMGPFLDKDSKCPGESEEEETAHCFLSHNLCWVGKADFCDRCDKVFANQGFITTDDCDEPICMFCVLSDKDSTEENRKWAVETITKHIRKTQRQLNSMKRAEFEKKMFMIKKATKKRKIDEMVQTLEKDDKPIWKEVKDGEFVDLGTAIQIQQGIEKKKYYIMGQYPACLKEKNVLKIHFIATERKISEMDDYFCEEGLVCLSAKKTKARRITDDNMDGFLEFEHLDTSYPMFKKTKKPPQTGDELNLYLAVEI